MNPSRIVLYNVTAEVVPGTDRPVRRIRVTGFRAHGADRNGRVTGVFVVGADGEFGEIRIYTTRTARTPSAGELANEWADLAASASAALETALC